MVSQAITAVSYHLAAGEGLNQPILHIAELLDWAEGGPEADNLELPAQPH